MQARVLHVDGRVTFKELAFSPPALAGMAWPVIEIVGDEQGPLLCAMAGMHVNEVCSMEAALRLPAALAGAIRRGRVEIMPVVNLPALWERTVQLCPIDGKNLNFSFPGDAAGSFTPALAHALLHEWAADAELLIDMHGGDLQTQVSHFVMCQMTGHETFDERTRRFAHCFDAEVVVEFAAGQSQNHGRSCNARPELGRHAVMSEGGSNGLLAEDDVRYHLDGVLNCAALLGITDLPLRPAQQRQQRVSGFLRLAPTENVRMYPRVRAGQQVQAGDVLAELRDLWGRPAGALTAPSAGPVIFCLSHPIVAANEFAVGLGQPIS